ncbi:MAG TPA: L,D-transpeptidase [Chloroflexia bacterium]|nr:L,D-transpeptidase [Chloroflexia bacterium]
MSFVKLKVALIALFVLSVVGLGFFFSFQFSGNHNVEVGEGTKANPQAIITSPPAFQAPLSTETTIPSPVTSTEPATTATPVSATTPTIITAPTPTATTVAVVTPITFAAGDLAVIAANDLNPSPTPEVTVQNFTPPTLETDVVALGLVAPVPVSGNGRWIDFNRQEGVTRLMEGNKVVKTLPSAYGYGIPGSDSDFYSTAPGQYNVYEKNPDLVYDGTYSGLYFEGWVGFDKTRANGFHSFLLNEKGEVVDNRTGPVSHGCIRTEDWRAIFDFAEVGMPVIVHDSLKADNNFSKMAGEGRNR